MQNNQSIQSIPSFPWQRRAARTTSSCIQEHWGIILHPIPSGKSRCSSPSHRPGRSPCLLHSSSHTRFPKSMTFHVLPHWYNSPAHLFCLAWIQGSPPNHVPHCNYQLMPPTSHAVSLGVSAWGNPSTWGDDGGRQSRALQTAHMGGWHNDDLP